MKTIIAGSRTITDYALVERAIKESGFEITQVVSGCARGVDTLGEQWGYAHNVPIAHYPADWNMHGRIAGPIRNSAMAEYADALIAIRANGSRGTTDMIDKAQKRGLRVFVLDVAQEDI